MDELQLIDPSDNTQLTSQLMKENDPAEIKKIINMVNLNNQKKDVVRSTLLSDLQDKIANQMAERVNKRPGEFSNKDLLDYMNSIQNILSKTSLSETAENITTIAIQNNTTVNVDSLSEFDEESKDRIKDALKAILGQAKEQSNIIEGDYTPVYEEQIEDDEPHI